MSIDMWNKRYAQENYVYGKEPNQFFKQELDKLEVGSILLPAEGEGRNAVYAAANKWNVVAFDSSTEAYTKAQKLALEKNVHFTYYVDSFDHLIFPDDKFNVIGLFYAHIPNRRKNHQRLITYLKKGGKVILEAFEKGQLMNDTGGPKNIDLLFSVDELKEDFKDLSELKVWVEEVELSEGEHHKGKAKIVRLIGTK